jgi:hypothetical protein
MTNVGFEKEEIKNTSTEDLLNLKYSIAGYLKSKKLKKRNMKYMLVFQRITKELKLRNGEYTDIADSTTNTSLPEEKRMLTRKTSRLNELSDLEIPSFLNDKKEPEVKECNKNCQCEINNLKGNFNFI